MDLLVFDQAATCLSQTVEASHCHLQCWTSSKEAVNINFCSQVVSDLLYIALWHNRSAKLVLPFFPAGSNNFFFAADQRTAAHA